MFVFVAVWSFRLTNYADRHVPYMWQCYNCSRLPDNDVMSHSTHCSSSACCRLNVNGGNKLPSNADSGVSSKLDLNNSLFQRAGRHRPQALFRTLRVSIQELTVVFRPSRNLSSSACCRLNVKGGSNLLSNADSGGSSKLDLQLMIVFVCQILSRQAMQFCDRGIAFHKGVVLGLTASLRHNREWQCHMDAADRRVCLCGCVVLPNTVLYSGRAACCLADGCSVRAPRARRWKRLIAVFVFVAVWFFRLTNYADRHVRYVWQCYDTPRSAGWQTEVA